MEERRKRIGLSPSIALIGVLTLFVLVFASEYLIVKASTFSSNGYSLLEKFFGTLLLAAEAFIFLHTIGFLTNILKSTGAYNVIKDTYFAPYCNEPVTCFICSYNEPIKILEETLASIINLNYKNKKIILLDDSTGGIRTKVDELGKRYQIEIIRRKERAGFKAGAINNGLNYNKSKYFVVFDADQKPVPNFLNALVYIMEEDEKLALIQTPQFYANTENQVAMAAWNKQSIFYEYICEGKSASNAMFCCGSNFIARSKAIKEIGGFDENTVTEDFATTLKLHKNGWKTMYYNIVYATGLGPETLNAYFSQQYRWAHGTVTTFKDIVRSFIKDPFTLTIGQWWEYLLSSTYFFTGWTNFIFIIMPISFILFGVRSLILDPIAYLAAFIPYFVLTMVLFGYSMRERGYIIKDLVLGQAISLATFSIYMLADTAALIGIKTRFTVTSKEDTGHKPLPLRLVWPQLFIFALSSLAVIVGSIKGLMDGNLILWINVFWAFYHSVLLGYFFVINSKIIKRKTEAGFLEYTAG